MTDLRVLYALEITPEDEVYFRSIINDGIELECMHCKTPEDLADVVEGFEVVIAGRANRETLKKAPGLKWFIVPWAGINRRTRDALLERPDITVLNSHFNAGLVAEHTWALILACAKRIVEYHGRLSRGDWAREMGEDGGVGLDGKTLVIIGYGTVGRAVAARAPAFGMTALGVRRTPGTACDGDVKVTGPEGLEDLLKSADVVVACLPDTKDTEGLVGEFEIRLLGPDTIFINVGRGKSVNEEALFTALKEGRIRSAGLDTWYNYSTGDDERRCTMPSNLPFWEMENVVMSPHRATYIEGREQIRIRDVAEKINAIARGSTPPDIVDLSRGY